MTDLIIVPHANQWHKLKTLVLDSVSSPITKRVYNLGLDEFFAWYGQESRAGFTKATVSAWRVSLEARGLGSISINVRITAVRKLAVEAADNGLLAARTGGGDYAHQGRQDEGRPSRQLALRATGAGAVERAGCRREEGPSRPRDPGRASRLRVTEVGGCIDHVPAHPAAGRPMVQSLTLSASTAAFALFRCRRG